MLGAHVIVYSTDAEADRTFLRDLLDLRSVDAGDGWLILALPPAEVAVHPTEGAPRHELYLMTDDLEAELERLAGRGVVTTGPVTDEGWGLLTAVRMPSGAALPIYEPHHPTAI